MNLQQTAFAIYELMKSFSILKITNCMTRLRLQLNTEDIANLPLKELKNIPNVLGVNLNDNELQIILGPGKVNEVTAEFKKLYANKNLETNAQNTNQDTNNNQKQFGNAEELHQQIRKKNATPFKLLLKRISNIFMPLIPAFIACGLITGLLNIAFKIDPTLTNYPAIQVLQIAGNAVFFGLNIFVGINTAKEVPDWPSKLNGRIKTQGSLYGGSHVGDLPRQFRRLPGERGNLVLGLRLGAF
mgnify:CR=1 FL=1